MRIAGSRLLSSLSTASPSRRRNIANTPRRVVLRSASLLMGSPHRWGQRHRRQVVDYGPLMTRGIGCSSVAYGKYALVPWIWTAVALNVVSAALLFSPA